MTAPVKLGTHEPVKLGAREPIAQLTLGIVTDTFTFIAGGSPRFCT